MRNIFLKNRKQKKKYTREYSIGDTISFNKKKGRITFALCLQDIPLSYGTSFGICNYNYIQLMSSRQLLTERREGLRRL